MRRKPPKRVLGPLEEPGQRLRLMTLMDAIPGHAETPETGPPIMILTLAHRGEIEPAMSLSLADAKLMWVKVTETLASHGDEFCVYIIDEYLT